MSKALLSPGWSLLCLCSQTPCTTQALCAKVKLVHHLTATEWWGPPRPQQCQYCLPDSAYCIWRKVAEHCLPVLPPGSMISPSNKSGKADDLLRWVWPPHTPPWSSSGQGSLTSREQTAAAHTAPHLTAWWAPLDHVSISPSLSYTYTVSDMETPGSGNALLLISRCVEKSQDTAHLADPCPHTCSQSLWEGTREEGWSHYWRDKRRQWGWGVEESRHGSI